MTQYWVAPIGAAMLAAVACHASITLAADPSSSAGSAKAVESKVDSTKAAVDPLVVTATGDPVNRVGRPVFMMVAIKNTAGDDLLLKNITIRVDGASADRFSPSSLK